MKKHKKRHTSYKRILLNIVGLLLFGLSVIGLRTLPGGHREVKSDTVSAQPATEQATSSEASELPPQPANTTPSTPASKPTPAPVDQPKAATSPKDQPKTETTQATPAPTPTPTATTTPTSTTDIASETDCPGQKDVAQTTTVLVCMTSFARQFHKLSKVTANGPLMESAAAKAQDMSTCGYGHTACGLAFDYWIKQKNYAGKCYAENVAYGQKTPGDVFVAWMNSAGHRANILESNYKDIGVAAKSSSSGLMWVMQLGGC